MSQANPTKSEVTAYASYYVLHGEQSNAFRAAFPTSKAKAETIHEAASRFHSKSKVQTRIKELSAQVQAIAKEEFKIDAAWVLEQAQKVYLRCMQEEEIKIKGRGTGEFKFEAAGANKSLEIIGKHIDVQAFNENLSIKTGGEVCPWGEIKASVDKIDE